MLLVNVFVSADHYGERALPGPWYATTNRRVEHTDASARKLLGQRPGAEGLGA